MVKPTDATLNAILARREFYTADLITITLQNGSTLHYCSGQQNIVFNGSTYTAGGIPDSTSFGGPYWDRKDNKAKVMWKIGSGNDSLVIDVIPGAAMVGPSASTVKSPDLVFDGSSDSFYSSTTVGVINAAGGALTFSAWFNSVTPSGVILSAIDNRVDVSAAVSFENALYIDSSGFLRGGWFDGAVKVVNSSAAVDDGNWHHGAIVITQSSNIYLYVDSTKSSTLAVGTLNTATPQLFIADGASGGSGWGGLPVSGHNRYTGKTADIRVYNRALSSAEIATLFAGGSPSSASIAGEYNSTAGTDTSGAGHNLTVVNTPTAGTDGPSALASTTVVSGDMTFTNGIRAGLFDNADFLLQRAFMQTYGIVPTTNCAVTMFQGLVGMINVDRAIATFSIDDYRVLFNQQMPRNLFAPTCQNTLYDANCSLSAAANASSGTLSAGSTLASIVSTNLTSTGGWFDNGKITWITGLNAGIITSISSYSTSPNPTITLTSPLPFAPSTTDTFQAFPGCDRSTGTGGCGKNWASTGSNIVNFRGMPYIPDPGTAL